MSRGRSVRVSLTKEELRAKRRVRDALDASKGTGDYSAVRAAIADYLAEAVDPESVTK